MTMPQKPEWVPELKECKANLRELCKDLDIDFDKQWRKAKGHFNNLSPSGRDTTALTFMLGYIVHAYELKHGAIRIKKPKEKSLAERVAAGVVVVKPKGFYIPEDDLKALCDCPACEEGTFRMSEYCALYRKKLVEKYPITPFTLSDGREVYRVGDLANIPKELLDNYVNTLVDRLRALRRPIDEFQRERMLWRIDELEDMRRALHLDILKAAGLDPFDIGLDAVAFKVVVEDYVEKRAQRFGGF